MAQIKVTELTFCYDGSYDMIFEHVSFQIDTVWKLGFIGRNGKGKTTFLKLLMGEYEYGGTITSPVRFRYFPFEVAQPQWLTVDVVEDIVGDIELWQLKKEMATIGLKEEVLYRQFCMLSQGEQTKMMLVILFLREGNFLLIDEPTNHLDSAGRRLVSAYLRKKSGFILVSHDRAFLDDCIDHVLSINRANIEVQAGNFSSWYHNKNMQDQFELAENEKLEKDQLRLTNAAKRTSNWSDQIESSKVGTRNSGLRPDKGYIGHKSAKMMKRSKTIAQRRATAIEEKSKLLKNVEKQEPLAITPIAYQSKTLISAQNLSLQYGETVVCQHISFSVNRGERIALSGANGSGKSTLIKLLMGQDICYSGELQIGCQLVFSYVSQDTAHLTGNLHTYCDIQKINESQLKTILRKFDFTREQLEKNMEQFSQGQKKKVVLATSLCQKAHLYLWDEPLNYVDVIARMQLESLLLTYEPTLLFIEHDSAFVSRIATKTVLLEGAEK